MRTMRALLPLFLVTMVATTSTAAEHDLGKTDFPTSGSPAAQEHFLRGVLLLHSFEYEDVREAFRAAREVEPGFAMAAWGEAMTHNHPIWLQENLEEGRAALERLAPTPDERLAKAPTEREKGYLRAVEILFAEGHLAALRKRRQDALAEATEGAYASGYTRTGGVRTLEAQVIELQLEALLHRARGRHEQALEKRSPSRPARPCDRSGTGPTRPRRAAADSAPKT